MTIVFYQVFVFLLFIYPLFLPLKVVKIVFSLILPHLLSDNNREFGNPLEHMPQADIH